MQFIRQCFGMSKKVPQRIVDPHHHFYTPSVEEGPGGHSGFLRKLGAPDYPPEDYVKDKDQLNIVKSVHVEALKRILPTVAVRLEDGEEQLLQRRRRRRQATRRGLA